MLKRRGEGGRRFEQCLKHRKNCERCPSEIIWKIKFKCQICLFSLSHLSWLSWFSSPVDHEDHDNHDNNDVHDVHDDIGDHGNHDDPDDHDDRVDHIDRSTHFVNNNMIDMTKIMYNTTIINTLTKRQNFHN